PSAGHGQGPTPRPPGRSGTYDRSARAQAVPSARLFVTCPGGPPPMSTKPGRRRMGCQNPDAVAARRPGA
ncbi:hypothetical protein LV779_02555, partial [Streptomyces thinghirensis]|nr:hypothetical protein [Streptomyces thinghirensis]